MKSRKRYFSLCPLRPLSYFYFYFLLFSAEGFGWQWIVKNTWMDLESLQMRLYFEKRGITKNRFLKDDILSMSTDTSPMEWKKWKRRHVTSILCHVTPCTKCKIRNYFENIIYIFFSIPIPRWMKGNVENENIFLQNEKIIW